MTPAVWVLGHSRSGAPSPWTLQLVSGAHQLADLQGAEVGVVMQQCEGTDELAAHGADRVVTVEGTRKNASAEAMVSALMELFGSAPPAIMLVPDSIWGRDIGSQIAAQLGGRFFASCERLAVREDETKTMEVIRSCFGGQVSEAFAVATDTPLVLGVREYTFLASAARPGAAVTAESVSPIVNERIGVIERRPSDPATVDLNEAQVIVSGGRGVGGAEAFDLLQQIAARLGGTTAASRMAIDLGWVPRTKQVGQTGSRVAPELYLACGISGAREHMVGIREAGSIVAINIDERAPIMQEADLAIVGDVGEVLGSLLLKLGAEGSQT